MRVMQISPFPRKVEILDFDFFVRSRLTQAIVLWSEQAIALVGYMAWPNDPDARAASVPVLRGWFEGSKVIPPRLRQIQTDWVRVADIFNLHCDLTAGGHQQRRGGPSIGKAIAVAAASIRARGAHAANLWRAWKGYKDVAHLVTAAAVISHEARRMARVKPFGESGLPFSQLQPFLIAMLMPDFVISLALSFQEHGLSEGFSHFVTSIAAPVASGWSVSPGGACTHWKAPPFHGARQFQTHALQHETIIR